MSRSLCGMAADSGQSYTNLEAGARRIREQLGYALDNPIDAPALFEDLNDYRLLICGREVPLVTGVDGIDAEGLTRFDDERNRMELLVSEETYEGLIAGRPRATYCFCHELGHAVLHGRLLFRLAQLPDPARVALHRCAQEHEPYMDTEWQANAFAGALLMPARGLAALEKRGMRLRRELIADHFGASREAAGYRLETYRARRLKLLEA